MFALMAIFTALGLTFTAGTASAAPADDVNVQQLEITLFSEDNRMGMSATGDAGLCQSVDDFSGTNFAVAMSADSSAIATVGFYNDAQCLVEVDRVGANSINNDINGMTGATHFRVTA